MKMLLQQLAATLRQGWILTLMIIIVFSGGLFLVIGTTSYYEKSNAKLTGFVQAYDASLHRYAVQISGYQTHQMIEDKDAASKLQKFYQNIEDAKEFDSAAIAKYQFHCSDFAGPDKFLYGYEDGRAMRDIEYGDLLYTTVKAYEIAPQFFKQFALTVCEGKDFSDLQDRSYSANRVYPIVLGWDYHEYYSIGDRIEDVELQGGSAATAKTMKIQFEVCGFLEPGAAIVSGINLNPSANNDQIIYLDTFMIMPMIDYSSYVPQDFSESFWLKFTEYNRSHSHVVITDKPPEDIYAIAQGYAKDAGFGGVNIIETMVLTNLFRSEANSYFNLLRISSIFIIVASVVCLSINLINKLSSQFKTYAIHLISGATMRIIRRYVAGEVLFVVLCSNLIAYFAALTFGGQVFSYSKVSFAGIQVTALTASSALAATLISLAVIVITLAIPYLRIYRTEFDSLLRGRE